MCTCLTLSRWWSGFSVDKLLLPIWNPEISLILVLLFSPSASLVDAVDFLLIFGCLQVLPLIHPMSIYVKKQYLGHFCLWNREIFHMITCHELKNRRSTGGTCGKNGPVHQWHGGENDGGFAGGKCCSPPRNQPQKRTHWTVRGDFCWFGHFFANTVPKFPHASWCRNQTSIFFGMKLWKLKSNLHHHCNLVLLIQERVSKNTDFMTFGQFQATNH